MANYVMERDAAKLDNAFGVFVDGKNIGWFNSVTEAQVFIQQCFEAENEVQDARLSVATPSTLAGMAPATAADAKALSLDARIAGESKARDGMSTELGALNITRPDGSAGHYLAGDHGYPNFVEADDEEEDEDEHAHEEEVTTDPREKLRRSIKLLRQHLTIQAEEEGVEDIVNALVDVAAHALMTQSQVAASLERIANAAVAQTKVMCAVYSQGLTLEETAKRFEDAKSELKE